MRLYLIRHPAVLVPPGICYGATDIAVAPQELKRVLAALTPSATSAALPNPPTISIPAAEAMTSAHSPSIPLASLPAGLALYSSPLQRCRCLAEPLAFALASPPPSIDTRLVEMNFGDWELKSWDQIARSEIDAWTADLVEYRPGAGETVLEMAHRVQNFYTQILTSQQDAIVICHAGTIRMLLACRRHTNPRDIALHAASTAISIAYGQPIVIDF